MLTDNCVVKELWIGVVEVLTNPSTGSGDTCAFTNVVTWATSEPSYITAVSGVFSEYGWTVLGTENARPIDPKELLNEEISEVIECARLNLNACIFGTFHYYPSKHA